MSVSQRQRLMAVAVPYVAVLAAVAAGIAPIWCLGGVFALPLAVRVVRAQAGARFEALEFVVVFVGQVVVGLVIKGIVR